MPIVGMKLPAEIHKLLDTPETPELGPGPRKQVTPEKTLNDQLKTISASELLRAAILRRSPVHWKIS